MLARPDVAMTLAEPLHRRVTFLHEVRDALALDVDVVRARAEELPRASYDVVVARAVAPLPKLVHLALPVLATGGAVVALKGSRADAEARDVRPHLELQGWSVDVFPVTTEGETTSVVRIARRSAPPNRRHGS